MTELAIAFGVFVLAVCGLALGALAGRSPLRGSCGGDPAINACPLCREKEER